MLIDRVYTKYKFLLFVCPHDASAKYLIKNVNWYMKYTETNIVIIYRTLLFRNELNVVFFGFRFQIWRIL